MLHDEIGDSAAFIAYHISDTFTVTGCVERRNYYVYTGVPNVCVDGLYVNVSDSYYWYRLRFDERKQVDSPLMMNLTVESYNAATGAGTVKVMIQNVSATDITGNLRFVATGDDTVGTWGGFNYLSDTALHIFPNATGLPGTILAGQTIEVTESFLIPGAWKNKPCTIVAFVQNDVDREIYQGAILHEIVLTTTSDVMAGELTLSWPTITGAAAYWIHGAVNQPYFESQIANRLVIIPAGTTTWSTTSGIGDSDNNWTYVIRAVDGSSELLTQSVRHGEFDFDINQR